MHEHETLSGPPPPLRQSVAVPLGRILGSLVIFVVLFVSFLIMPIVVLAIAVGVYVLARAKTSSGPRVVQSGQAPAASANLHPPAFGSGLRR